MPIPSLLVIVRQLGLAIIADILKEDESYFYNKNSFIDIFKELTHPKFESEKIVSEDIPESL